MHDSFKQFDYNNCEYPQQLTHKKNCFETLISPFSKEPTAVFDTTPHSYRMRVEFRIWHEQEQSHYAMHNPETKERYFIKDFAPACVSIRQRMPKLMKVLQQFELLRKRLFSVEFLATTQDEVLITLIYHRQLDDDWETQAEVAQGLLGAKILGRAKKQKVVLTQDYVTEHLNIDQNSENKTYLMRQIEGSFTQPNAEVNEKMVSWVSSQIQQLLPNSIETDLLELYCGNGNFTLPLSTLFNKVLATEISKSSIAALNWNIAENAINNIKHARLSAAETIEALDRQRAFRRLATIDLNSYQFSCIFVDPPRAGIDNETLQFIGQFDTIVYVSCNPETLAENLQVLIKTHAAKSQAVFDQFPFTPHLESAVVLQKRASVINGS